MADFSTSAAIQTDYFRETDGYPLGATWQGRQVSDLDDTSCGDMAVLTAGVFKFTNTNNNAGESWKVEIDGAQQSFTTGANATATSNALKAAIDLLYASGAVLEGKITGVTVNVAAVTVSLAEGYVPSTIKLVAPGGATSTFTEAYDTEPSVPHDHEPGYWVARDLTAHDPQLTGVKQPSSTSDVPYGIAVLEGAYARDSDVSVGPTRSYWPANRAMTVARIRPGGIMGRADGAIGVGDVGKPVYMVVAGARKRWSRKDDGGTSQVSELTVTPSATDTVGFHFDSLPVLEVTSVDLATDNAALRDKFNGNAQYAALGSAVVDAGKIIITWKDRATHVFADDSSGGTADVAHVAATEAVAAKAVLTQSHFMSPAADGKPVAINLHETK